MWFAILNIILGIEMSSFVKYERYIIRINVSMYINENMKELLQGIVVLRYKLAIPPTTLSIYSLSIEKYYSTVIFLIFMSRILC